MHKQPENDGTSNRDDLLYIYDKPFSSRLLLGTARYPSPHHIQESVKASETNMITVSLRRETSGGGNNAHFRGLLSALNVAILPNTAGCHTVKEAVNTALMARELFNTDFIKLEVIGHTGTLQPDPLATIEAAKILCDQGFKVFPYITDDLVICEKLVDIGCKVLMPWGAPIGTGKGLNNLYALRQLRSHFPNIPLIIDAGIGTPSDACIAMELGYDAILLNTAVARAGDPIQMAQAFKYAIHAGRMAYLSGTMPMRDTAEASSPEFGTAFSPFNT
ncbi:MAG: thiazole synthase [Alphaproteobacteria bacterium]|jgi:thiazole synthase